MLRYIKEHLATIDGVAIFPIVSLSIFFLFFAGLLWWILTMKKDYIKINSELPLDKSEKTPNE